MQDTLDRPLKPGNLAEEKASAFLQKKGLHLLVKNYRCHSGEIDLIMKEKDEIVFVEVRLRSQDHFGDAIESINKAKQQKLIKSALHYLQKNKLLDQVNCRFDIIGFSEHQIEWIKDAFSYE